MNTPDPQLSQLQQTVQTLTHELNNLKQIVANPTPLSADAYPSLLHSSSPNSQPLEMPLSRVIDLYRECPEILAAYAQRVTIDKSHFSSSNNYPSGDRPLTFNANPNGNFWVLQLQGQGCYLFPRPNDTKGMNRLSLLDQIFSLRGQNKNSQGEFDIVKPAELSVIKLQVSWRLVTKGELSYAQTPLHYQWQQELTGIRQQQAEAAKTTDTLTKQYEKISQTLTPLPEQYQTLNQALIQFRQQTNTEIRKYQSITQSQQETIDYLLALTEYLEDNIKANHKYIEEIINWFDQEEKLNQKRHDLIGQFLHIREKLGENKQAQKPQKPPKNGGYYPTADPLQPSATNDPFYNEVITEFNQGNIQYFQQYITQEIFHKVHITSASEKMDMGGKIIWLEPHQQGTLLIYNADNRYWLIPNINELKWKRVASADLFSGSPNNKLIRPAEVQKHGDKWKLVEKGEFQS